MQHSLFTKRKTTHYFPFTSEMLHSVTLMTIRPIRLLVSPRVLTSCGAPYSPLSPTATRNLIMSTKSVSVMLVPEPGVHTLSKGLPHPLGCIGQIRSGRDLAQLVAPGSRQRHTGHRAARLLTGSGTLYHNDHQDVMSCTCFI